MTTIEKLTLRATLLLSLLGLVSGCKSVCIPPPAGSGPKGKVVCFHIAALEVTVPSRSSAVGDVPALVYLELKNRQDQAAANEITKLTREKGRALGRNETEKAFLLGQEIELRIGDLLGELRPRFAADPHPLVLRVAAGKKATDGTNKPVLVCLRLSNLLPEIPLNDPNPDRFGTSWTSTTAIHAGLVSYDVTSSDGAAIGLNDPSIILRGASRDYHWSVNRELGACYLRDMADPTHQRFGLFGALIVEPPGARFESSESSSLQSDAQPGWSARILLEDDPKESFREFAIFTHSGWSNQRLNAINLFSAAGEKDQPPTPKIMVLEEDRILIRLIHAVGEGTAAEHSFFIDGQRWPFDFQSESSNRISAIALASTATFNLRLRPQPNVNSEQQYLYGCHVGEHLEGGEWGLFSILPKGNDSILPLSSR